MRPSILFPLFAEIRTLSGVGPKLEKLIAKVAGPRLVDLVFDLPVGVVDRSYRPKLAAAEPGRIATVEVTVLEHRPSRVKSQPYKVMVSDETSLMELVFFRAHADYLMGLLPVGARRLLSEPDREIQGPAANGASRLCGGAGRSVRFSAARAGLWPDRGPDGAADGEGGARRAGESAGDAGMAGPRFYETAQVGRFPARRWKPAHTPAHGVSEPGAQHAGAAAAGL